MTRRAAVVDASALVELLLKRRCWRTVESVLSDDDAYAPELLDAEVVSTLRRYWLAGELTDDRAEVALDVLTGSPIVRVPLAPLSTLAWHHRANLSAYDAYYVGLASLLGCRVLTRDAAIARAPGTEVAFEILPT